VIDRYVSPAELRRLLSALLVVATFIVIMAVFGFIVVPGLRNANRLSSEPVVNAPEGEMGWLDPTDYPPARSRTIPPIDPRTVMMATPELMTLGRDLYARTCATCHGATGGGDGPAAAGLTPKPRNLTLKTGWKNGTRIEDIYRTLEAGLKGSAMVSYKDLSKRDRMALVHFVQSLGAFDHGRSDPEALEALSRLFATSGEVVPAKIPVARAVDALVREFPAPPPLSVGPGWRAVVMSPERAARTLAGIPGWRESDQALARGVVAGAPVNGFSRAVFFYTGAQWKDFQANLSKMEP
jgi:mono/diheme cytochrome c family protein